MTPRSQGEDALKYWRVLLQIVLIVGTIVAWNSPALLPVKLLVVLLHELSHGLMALATGGEILDLHIADNETGACQTLGGNEMLIIGAGYLGSMFFGGLILTSSRSRAQAAVVHIALAAALIMAGLTVVKDPFSRQFTLAAGGIAVLLGLFQPPLITPLLLRTVGTICCLYALIDIYSDILSEAARNLELHSDATAFSQLTGIPPETVGLGWLVMSIVYFFVTLRASIAGGGASAPSGSPAPAPAHG